MVDVFQTISMSEPHPSKKKSKDGAMFWGATFGGIILIAVLVWCFDLKWLHDHAQSFNGVLVFVLTVFLPLVGVPVSAVYAVVGAKFGPVFGLAVAVVAIALHLLLSWWIAHSWLKRPLEALLRRTGRQIPGVPEGEYIPVCLLVALVPGASYTLKNYLLVLAKVPFRPFFWTLLPSHLVHATLAIFFGDFTGAMTTPKLVFLVSYAVMLIGLGHYVVLRLKRRKRQGQGIGPVQDASS
jgi:uncharacterized membrane protein YdjX (TVP38/TMEM64 family)